jgi:hypothetical protein
MGGNRVRNVAVPIAGTDAANKDYVDGRIDAVNARVDDNREGIAMAMALNVPFVSADKDFSMNGRFGHFKGKTAMAFSGAARLNEFIQVDAGVTVGVNSGNVGVSGGLSVAW